MPEGNRPVPADVALAELLPPLSAHEALVEANRCLFCYDAPCTHACPTHIDIPRFIKKIASENTLGSAKTILDANLLGATCSRVCPVQELCEGACVLGAEHKPIMIGRLQRYAMDFAYTAGMNPFRRVAETGKKVAVIGAGPAGLSCAGELAKRGHFVTVFERRDLAGGLSTHGIVALREPISVALAEVEMIRELGVRFETGVELGLNLQPADLLARYDAVFLSAGLGRTPTLGIPGEEHIVDGLAFIERSKLDVKNLQVGTRVVVVGAGNTAIDCATIAKRLGAEQVTMIYRRSEREMSAYRHEVEFVRSEGVELKFFTQPIRVDVQGERVVGLTCRQTGLGESDASGRPKPIPLPDSEFLIPSDQVIKAIGQERSSVADIMGLRTKLGYVEVDGNFETSVPRVFAGGDCIRSSGVCSTVMAVQDGKLAALAINGRLEAPASVEAQ